MTGNDRKNENSAPANRQSPLLRPNLLKSRRDCPGRPGCYGPGANLTGFKGVSAYAQSSSFRSHRPGGGFPAGDRGRRRRQDGHEARRAAGNRRGLRGPGGAQRDQGQPRSYRGRQEVAGHRPCRHRSGQHRPGSGHRRWHRRGQCSHRQHRGRRRAYPGPHAGLGPQHPRRPPLAKIRRVAAQRLHGHRSARQDPGHLWPGEGRHRGCPPRPTLRDAAGGLRSLRRARIRPPHWGGVVVAGRSAGRVRFRDPAHSAHRGHTRNAGDEANREHQARRPRHQRGPRRAGGRGRPSGGSGVGPPERRGAGRVRPGAARAGPAAGASQGHRHPALGRLHAGGAARGRHRGGRAGAGGAERRTGPQHRQRPLRRPGGT